MLFLSVIVMIAGLCFALVFPYFIPQAIEPFFAEITGGTFADLTQAEIRFHNLLSAVIGGTLFGWGLMIGLLSYRLMRTPEDWIWSVITISVLAWYVLDTLGSLLAGSSLNILLNTSILILALPPIIANRQTIVNSLLQ
ncbi:MAG: hypothetical protein ACXAEB_12350 [Candidatus Thorarchaeota archaeon]|jgi:hypothetical protein